MKKSILFAAIAALVLCSCGAQKKSATPPQYPPQVPQQQPTTQPGAQNYQLPINPTPPTVVEVEPSNPVELWQMEVEPGKIKAVGSRDAKNPTMARTYALEYAHSELANSITSFIQSAKKSYNKMISSQGEALSEDMKDEGYIKTIASETVSNIPPVMMHKEKLSNGNTRYWIGIEYKFGDNIDKLADRYASYVREKTDKLDFDAHKFEEALKSDFEEYEASRKSNQ